jgi:hypothetical protein
MPLVSAGFDELIEQPSCISVGEIEEMVAEWEGVL